MVTKWCGRRAECERNSHILPRDLWFWLRVVRGYEDFVSLVDKSQAC